MSLEDRLQALVEELGADHKVFNSARALPAYLEDDSPLHFNPQISAYNANASSLRRARFALARAMEGSGRFEMLCMGDSSLVGANGGGIIERFSIPKQIALCLSGMTGAPRDSGFVTVPSGIGSVPDRISITGGTSHNNPFATIPTGGSWTYTTEDAGDEVVIVWSGLSGNWQYSIDGKTPVGVTTTGGTVGNITTVSGQGDTTHTITISPTTASSVFILGVWVRKASGISVHNEGFGGSRSAGGSVSLDWTTGTGNTSLTLCRQLVRDSNVVTPSLVLVSIGPRDIDEGMTAVDALAALETMLGWYPNADKIIINNIAFSGMTAPELAEDALYVQGKYDLADEYNAVLIDWRDLMVDDATAEAANVLGPDGIHLDYGIQRLFARHIASVIAGGMGPGTLKPPRTVVNASGTTYTFKESDNEKHVRFTNAAAVAATIPADLSSSWECSWEMYGAGVPTFSGTTMRSRGGANKAAGQYAVGGIRQIDSDETLLFGDITT